MESIILKEGVLNDDYLMIPDEDKCFKGGYVAIIVSYTYMNTWANTKKVKRFRSINSLNNFLKNNYPAFEF